MNMKALKYILGFILISVLAACQDDIDLKGVKEGIPTTLNVKLAIPFAQKVNNSRAIEDYESEVNEVMLFLFSGSNNYAETLTLGNYIIESEGGREYHLSDATLTLMTGNYRAYAIANWSGDFCNLENIEDLTEDQLKSLIANKTAGIYNVTGTDRFPMSFYQEIEIVEEPSQNDLEIVLDRLTSHIEFTFENGTPSQIAITGGYTNPKFTPLTYSIYNLPKKANVISKESNIMTNVTDADYEDVTDIPVINNTIKFFMLENVQDLAENCSEYALRDKWVGPEGANPTNKTFTYAPENSTYIVVKGEYEDDKLRGNVSYTIHLGNFDQGENKGGSYNNFTVNRNEYHTYKVTIRGVQDIKTEATVKQEDGGNMPGAEGDLTQKNNVFVLDAHYETVMLKIPAALLENDKTAVINTPYNNKDVLTFKTKPSVEEYDYDWVEFKKPEVTTAFPKYFNKNDDEKRGTLYELLNNPEDYCLLSGDYYYTTAFVNEYFYDDETDLTKFINVDNRELILYNPEEISTSTDGNSIYREGIIFSITQRSIKSTYDLENTANPFGIETWDEFDPMKWGTTYTQSTLSKSNGYDNTVKLQSVNNKTIEFSQIGYLNSVASNTKEAHNWGAEDAVDNNAILAALSRNRDTDGDGKITGNELKWYIPSIHNYQTIWLGQDLLKEDTRLYDESLLSTLTGLTMDHQTHLYTSSADGQRLYWHEQGACYSETADWNNISWENETGYFNNIRCIRNLKDVDDEATLPVSWSGRIISVTGVANIREHSTTEQYGKHYERDGKNLLPVSFEVAEATLPSSSTKYYNVELSGNAAEIEEYINLAVINFDQNNKTGWRVPNQRELMLMDMCGFLPNNGANNGRRYSFVSSTWFSGTKTNRIYPFVFDSAEYGKNNANIALPSDGINGTPVVLFVRDNL